MDSINNIPHCYKLYIAWIIYFNFNWSNVTPFVWIQLTLEFHISLFLSSSQSNGKLAGLYNLYIIKFISILKKSNLILYCYKWLQIKDVIFFKYWYTYIGGLWNWFVQMILNTNIFPGDLSRSGEIWNERCVINIHGDIYYIRLRGKTRGYDASLRDQSLPSRVS